MDRELVVSLQTCFATVEDPRIERTKRHKLLDIIIIAICGVICGAEGWVEIEEFGKAKEMWLKELLELPNGIPSHDTFGRVFARLDPKQFEASFFAWVQSLHERITGVIAIDGKTLRRSHDQAMGKKALHIERLGSRTSLGVGSDSHRREIQRDRRDPEAFAATSLGRMHCHH